MIFSLFQPAFSISYNRVLPRAGRGLQEGLLLLLLAGCAVAPPVQMQRLSEQWGFQTRVLEGAGFQHILYLNRKNLAESATRLHVYLHGDGTPWLGAGRPAFEPTPRHPLTLKLMALDQMPSIYLSRPCYGGLAVSDPPCHPWLWTHGRYSESVVASLVAAVRRLLGEQWPGRLTLIGYSGGGTLAMLMAERLEQVDTVVSIAANLDIEQWTQRHGYSRLSASLNPARRRPLREDIAQLHWVGERDANVPPALIRSALRPQPCARLTILPGVDHACCWQRLWPTLLVEINQASVTACQDGKSIRHGDDAL